MALKDKKCCICGKEFEKIGPGRGVVCMDKECRIVYKMLAKHGIGYPVPKNYVWHSYSSNPRWSILPSKKIVEQKLKEVRAKNFLLDKISEAQFIQKSNQILNTKYCKQYPLTFKITNYEKQRTIFNTR